jgi:hypothetical protein
MPFTVSVHVHPDYVQSDTAMTIRSVIVNDSDDRTEPFAIHYKMVLPNGVEAIPWTLFKHHHMDPHEEWEEVILDGLKADHAGILHIDVGIFQDDVQVATGGRDIEIH